MSNIDSIEIVRNPTVVKTTETEVAAPRRSPDGSIGAKILAFRPQHPTVEQDCQAAFGRLLDMIRDEERPEKTGYTR